MSQVDLSDFKEILDSNGMYLVDVNGRVYSRYSEKILSIYVNLHGYPYYTLTIKGKKRNFSTHRLVLTYFGDGNPLNKRFINHIDGNKRNHKLNNLEWCTPSENSIHAIHVLGVPKPPSHLGKTGASSKLSKKVKRTDLSSGEIVFFDGAMEAERLTNGKFKQANISACARGEYKQYKGFNWEYV